MSRSAWSGRAPAPPDPPCGFESTHPWHVLGETCPGVTVETGEAKAYPTGDGLRCTDVPLGVVGGAMPEVWSCGEAYEPYVGRWSRMVAREFVPWLGVPPRRSWLDVGCGTGALTETVLALGSPDSVCGVDPSEGYVAFVAAHLRDPRTSFRTGDATALPFADGEFDATVSGLVLNFVPGPARAVAEMARVTRLGGVVGAYVWDYAEAMELMRYFWDAAVELDP